MAARKEIVREFVSQGLPVGRALAVAEVPRSSYYYNSIGKRKGRTPSTHTRRGEELVDNRKLVEEINDMLGKEFIDYGYERTTAELRNRGYTINKKKVYRLMKENQLLFPKLKRRPSQRTYVKFTVPLATRPFEIVEIDFKYLYIEGYKRHAYLITILDVFTRIATEWELNLTMKSKDAVRLVNSFLHNWNINPKELLVTIRTDNGSQFIAEKFRDYLQQREISNEYTHPGTPEQNAHIESFHNTLGKLVVAQYSFDTLQAAQTVLERFYHVYNHKRIMKSILYLTPMEFLKKWSEGSIGCKKEKKRIKYFFREKPTDQGLEDFPSEFFFLQNKDKIFLNKFINQKPILSSL